MKCPLHGPMCILLFAFPPVSVCASRRNMNSSLNTNVDVDSSSMRSCVFLVSVEHPQQLDRVRRSVLQRMLRQASCGSCLTRLQKKSSRPKTNADSQVDMVCRRCGSCCGSVFRYRSCDDPDVPGNVRLVSRSWVCLGTGQVCRWSQGRTVGGVFQGGVREQDMSGRNSDRWTVLA